MNKLKLILTLSLLLVILESCIQPQSGQFYKTKQYDGTITVIDVRGDSGPSKMMATAFQGLVNKEYAECYLFLGDQHYYQLEDTGREYEILDRDPVENPGLVSMFRKYHDRVRNIYIWDPSEDWTWNIALMLSSSNDGIPLTGEMYEYLTKSVPWTGKVEPLAGKWKSRIEAYKWAMDNLYSDRHDNVLFSLGLRSDWLGNPWTLYDYAIASKGFVFWLDDKDPGEAEVIAEICRRGKFRPGAIVMGYAMGGDDLLKITNRYSIGYVVSDYYANGSFWSSYPNKSFRQRSGRAVKAEPGKIYVSVVFSDGDNVQFDQNSLYSIWKEDKNRGEFPVGTTLSAGLQELNPFLLEWYYNKKTENDELVAGPSGYQFIYGRDYNDTTYSDWLDLNRNWLKSAGFKTGCLWHTTYGTDKFNQYIECSGLEGIFTGDDDVDLDLHNDVVIMNQGAHLWNEGDLYKELSERFYKSDTGRPYFINVYPIAAAYAKDGISKLKREAERLEKEFPGKFIFLLPMDNVATAKSYYEEHPDMIPWGNK